MRRGRLMAIGRAMVDDESWWTVRSDAPMRTGERQWLTSKRLKLGACRCGGHDAGRPPILPRASGLAPWCW
jgi:hypothetical protein